MDMKERIDEAEDYDSESEKEEVNAIANIFESEGKKGKTD